MLEPHPRRPLQRYLFSPLARRVWALALSLLLLFTLVMALSPHPPEEPSLGWDKANHGLAFGLLAFVGVFALQGGGRARWLLAAGLFAFGGVIELLQVVVPGHQADWQDLLADTVGIAIGLAIGVLLARRFERRRVSRDARNAVHSSRR